MIHDSLENNESQNNFPSWKNLYQNKIVNTFWVNAFLDFVISLTVTQLIMYRNVF